MHNIFKKLLFVVLLILFPLSTVLILGAIFIVIQMISGVEPMEGFKAFMAILYSLKPYFPYLTTVPVALFLLVQLFKNWRNIKK